MNDTDNLGILVIPANRDTRETFLENSLDIFFFEYCLQYQSCWHLYEGP